MGVVYANWQELSIGLDNGLVPNRRQANDYLNQCVDLIHWRIYATQMGDELMVKEGWKYSHIFIFQKTIWMKVDK